MTLQQVADLREEGEALFELLDTTNDNKKGRCQRHGVFSLAGTLQKFSCEMRLRPAPNP